ncbi:MAG: efflux RND transporter periplasmic adaptor subunit [Myxococcota bacterium]
MNLKLRTFAAVVFFGALSVLSACEGAGAKEDGKELGQSAPRVRAEKIERRAITEAVPFTGTIEPYESVNLTPDVPGRVLKIFVKEGDRVKKGALIARLDTKAAELQYEQAKAAMGLAEANLKAAEQSYERMKALHESNSISKDQWEKVEFGFEAAGKQLEQARSAVALAEYQIKVSAIYAPFEGIITYKGVSEQEHISPLMMSFGQNPITVVTLTDISRVFVVGNLAENDMVRVKKGMKAIIKIDSLPERSFEGEVAFINPVADPMSRTFKVKIEVENAEETLKGGMYARAEVITDASKEALVVPRSALLNEPQGNYVFVTEGDNVARKIWVKTGLSRDGMVEITEGLSNGQRVIVDGNFGLRDGLKIEIMKD